jgi:hypothetical protein
MNDIERATQIARAMVTQYGMSDALGPQQLGNRTGEPFLGKEVGHEVNYSDEMAAAIDTEIRRMLDEAHAEAREILTLHRPTLDRLAEALVARETLADADLEPIWNELDLPSSGRTGDASDRLDSAARDSTAGAGGTGPSENVTAAEADGGRDQTDVGPPRFREP